MKFMEDVKAMGNFWFLHNINEDLYKQLSSAESIARINFREYGSSTRDVLETMVGYIIRDCNLEDKIPSYLPLYEKIKNLRDETFLKDAGYLGPDESLKDKPTLPSIGIVKTTYESGDSDEIDYYDFLRRFGNACSHSEPKPTNVKVDYNHVYKCLKGYHLFLRKYYSKRISKDTPDFMDEFMPIDEYWIEESYVPNDTLRSKCIREFSGYTLDSKGNKAFYGILRLYNKKDVNEDFILRNTDAFVEASKVSISSVPEGMTGMRELVPYNDNKSSFYIIAYRFNRKPEKLTQRLLKKMDYSKRLMICQRIANCFYNLHRSEVPIFHRMLSDESLYLCDFGKRWEPYVIKFDFAKILFEDDLRTVIIELINAKDRLEDLKQIKYLAPEWETVYDTSKTNWEKIDIYSLGVVFRDILVAEIGVRPIDISKLQKLDTTMDLLKLIDSMGADSPDVRPDIEKVLEVLTEEVKHCN